MAKVVGKSAVYLAGEIVSKAVPFAMLPYLTRVLGVEGFGELAYLLMLFSLFYVFISISQDGALARYYFRYGGRGTICVSIAGCCYSLVVGCLMTVFFIFIGKVEYIGAVVMAVTQSILALVLSYYQCRERPLYYVMIQVACSVLISLATFLVFYFLVATPLARIIIICLCNVITLFMVYLYLSNKNLFDKYSVRGFRLGLKYVLWYGVPLIIHQLSFFGKGQFDRFVVQNAFSLTELGVYSAAFQLASILTVLLYAANKAIVPAYYRALKKSRIGGREVLKFAAISILLCPIPAGLAFAFPESIYSFVLGEGYAGVRYFVVFFLLGLMLHLPYQILANYLFYFGLNKRVALCTLTSGIVHVLCLYYVASLGDLKLLPIALLLSNAVSVGLLLLVVAYGNQES